MPTTEPVFTRTSVSDAIQPHTYQTIRSIANAVLKARGSSFKQYTEELGQQLGHPLLAERRTIVTVENILLRLESENLVESQGNRFKKLDNGTATIVAKLKDVFGGTSARVAMKNGSIHIVLDADDAQALLLLLR